MNCRLINKMICNQPNEETLTYETCSLCLQAHMSSQLNKLIKTIENRPQRLNTNPSYDIR